MQFYRCCMICYCEILLFPLLHPVQTSFAGNHIHFCIAASCDLVWAFNFSTLAM